MLQVRSVGLIHALLESRKRLRRISAGGLLQRLPSHKVSTCLAHQDKKKNIGGFHKHCEQLCNLVPSYPHAPNSEFLVNCFAWTTPTFPGLSLSPLRDKGQDSFAPRISHPGAFIIHPSVFSSPNRHLLPSAMALMPGPNGRTRAVAETHHVSGRSICL